MDHANRKTLRLTDRILIGVFLLLTLMLIGIGAARAGEMVPSVGLTRAITSDASVKAFGGLAVRGSALPMINAEIAVAYRSEPYFNGDLNLKMMPLTASLWFTGLPMVYVGGGVGVYRMMYDYKAALGFKNQTSHEFGAHVGGGLGIPLVPGVASLDLQARYVQLPTKDTPLAAKAIRQSFVSTGLGVSIKF
jgi:hypothetical protein